MEFDRIDDKFVAQKSSFNDPNYFINPIKKQIKKIKFLIIRDTTINNLKSIKKSFIPRYTLKLYDDD